MWNEWKKKANGSLRLLLVGYTLFSLFAGVACFGMVFQVFDLVFHNYIFPKQRERMIQNTKTDFQLFVNENNLTSNDSRIATWVSDDLRVYALHTLALPDGKNETNHTKPPDGDSQINIEIQYVDQAMNTNFIVLELNTFEMAAHIVSAALSLLLFFIIFYKLLGKKVGYLLHIEAGVSIMESGDLGYVISQNGQDELSRLAESINRMAKSFISHIKAEQEAIQTSKEIIGDLSHDIRTPLTILSGYIPLLLASEPLTKMQREYLTLIDSKTAQMRSRVDELTDYAAIYSGQQPINKLEVPVTEVLDTLTETLAPFADVKTQINVRDDTRILADMKLLSRLFDNLVSNIMRHGDLRESVFISALTSPDKLCIEIGNTAGNSYTGKSLGLKICRHIANCHDGSLEIKTNAESFVAMLEIPLSNRC